MLRDFLAASLVVSDILTEAELDEMAASGGTTLSVMMGITFDHGQPLDLLKYGLFLIGLQEALERAGNKVRCTWVLADHFVVDINRDEEEAAARAQVRARIDFLERLNRAYGGAVGFALSSELSRTERYAAVLRSLLDKLDSSPEFRALVLQAVPQDRRGNPKALRYPLEEMAAIAALDTDVKVGPLYERFYDRPARSFGPALGLKRYVGIYLTRCYPFGAPEIEPAVRAEIERFGVLPYKLGSKGLAEFRIDPLDASLAEVEELVRTTVDSRALRDLATVLALARARRTGRGPGAAVGEDEIERWARSPETLLGLYREHVAEALADQAPPSNLNS